MKRIARYHCELVRERHMEVPDKRVTSPEVAAQVADTLLGATDCENFAVLLLDTKNNVIGATIATTGTINAALVTPREVFKPAFLTNAAAVIIVHNHPSGDPLPSREDFDVTKRIAEAGKILGIEVLDHIIIATDPFSGALRWLSIREHGAKGALK